MYWLRAITGVLLLGSSTAWGATLTWDANKEGNLAGYNVYRCSTLPCTPKTGASLLVSLRADETSLYIGIPTEIQYYFVTAYNKHNRESGPSNVLVVMPAGSPPPPPPPGGLRIDLPK